MTSRVFKKFKKLVWRDVIVTTNNILAILSKKNNIPTMLAL